MSYNYFKSRKFTNEDFEDFKAAVLYYFGECDGIEYEFQTEEDYDNWHNFTFERFCYHKELEDRHDELRKKNSGRYSWHVEDEKEVKFIREELKKLRELTSYL